MNGKHLSEQAVEEICLETIQVEANEEQSASLFKEQRAEIYIETGGENVPLSAILESLLFVTDAPVEPSTIAKILNFDTSTIEHGLQRLAEAYENAERGLRLQQRNGKFQLVTQPAVASVIEDFLNLDTSTKLSGPALETLAVIAYRQPITRVQIEAVRGVDSAGVLRSLVQRGLVEEIGRLEVAGRPILYSVTDSFMQHFGLTKLGELPPLETTEADTLWATTKLAELEEVHNGKAPQQVSGFYENRSEL